MLVRKVFSLLIVFTLLGSSAWAIGPYLKGGLSASLLTPANFVQPGMSKEAKFQLGYGLLFGVGWDFDPVSVEVEGLYLDNSFSEFSSILGKTVAEGNYSATALMLNGLYHLGPYGYFSPFLLVGAGGAKVELAGVKDGENDLGDASGTALAYQVGLGLDVKLTPEIHLEGGYRYFAANQPEFDGTSAGYKAHLFCVALKILLGEAK